MLTTYSKVLEFEDYNLMTEPTHVQNIKSIIGPEFGQDHPHRDWEYGLVLNALRQIDVKTVLDVGGNGSAFAPAAAWLDMEVLQVDVSPSGDKVAQQAVKIGKPLSYLQEDFFKYNADRKFDAVVCISVLEHVPAPLDIDFFERLLTFVDDGGLVAITVDFHPSGAQMHQGHFRTYNEEGMRKFMDIAGAAGFVPLGNYDYTYHGDAVFNYSFASLIMRKG